MLRPYVVFLLLLAFVAGNTAMMIIMRRELLGERSEIRQGRDVLRNAAVQASPPHLYHDRTTVPESRGVHLRDRRGGEWDTIEESEQLLQGAAELALDRRLYGSEVHRRKPIVQPLELDDVSIREQVTPQRQYLSELEEYDAQLLQRLAHLRGRRPVALAAYRAHESVFREDTQDPQQARRGSNRVTHADGRRRHGGLTPERRGRYRPSRSS